MHRIVHPVSRRTGWSKWRGLKCILASNHIDRQHRQQWDATHPFDCRMPLFSPPAILSTRWRPLLVTPRLLAEDYAFILPLNIWDHLPNLEYLGCITLQGFDHYSFRWRRRKSVITISQGSGKHEVIRMVVKSYMRPRYSKKSRNLVQKSPENETYSTQLTGDHDRT
jgi:hypothetical protein